jgi:predicted MFS family arabinose efflux permease
MNTNFQKLSTGRFIYQPFCSLLVLMVPSIVYAEKKKKFREMFLLGVLLIGLGFLAFLLKHSFLTLVLLVFFFLVGFHLLEPIIPSLLTRLTHRDIRGLSLGFFNTTQFVGAFLGGLWGGFVLKHGLIYMTTLGFLFSLLWLFGAYFWFKRL